MLRKLRRDECGAIAVISALSIVAVIGVSALAVEFGHGLLQRTENQRVADLAALGGALVQNAGGDGSGAAGNIVVLNGLPSSAAVPSIVDSPTGDGNKAMQVTVTTSLPLYLARVLISSATLPVSATSIAEMRAGSPACITALDPSGPGIELSGTGSIDAPGCAIASNSTVCDNAGVKSNPSNIITTKLIAYDSGTVPTGTKCTVSPPAGTASVRTVKTATADPLAAASGTPGSAEVASATARLATMAGAPSVPGGTGVYFDSNSNGSTTIASLTADGCSGTFASVWTVTCAPNVTLGELVLGGGITVNFVSTGVTYNISTVAPSGHDCSVAKDYSICNTGTALSFAGPSTFVLAGGIYNKGGATLTMGSGSTANSYEIGAARDGNSINVSTSHSTTFGDATGTGGIFQTAGNIVSGGGTCFQLPAAAEHDINGYISLAGGTTLGAGIYTVSDYVAFGNNNGGVQTCNGTPIGVSGAGVTFVLGGNKTPASGNCAGQAFCVAAGFDDSTLTAPTSGPTADLVVVGPQSAGNTAGATFTEGGSNWTLSGAFYFPHGPIDFAGAATVNTPPNACLEMVGSSVTLTAGTAVGTSCTSLGGTPVGRGVALVD